MWMALPAEELDVAVGLLLPSSPRAQVRMWRLVGSKRTRCCWGVQHWKIGRDTAERVGNSGWCRSGGLRARECGESYSAEELAWIVWLDL